MMRRSSEFSCCCHVNENMDLCLLEYGVLYAHLVHVHRQGRIAQNALSFDEAASFKRGGERERLTKCSLLYYASIFLGIDPDEVDCRLAGTFRGLTKWMAAHTDPDMSFTTYCYYIRGSSLALQQGDRLDDSVQVQGCLLSVCSEECGGVMATVNTDPGDGYMAINGFNTAKQLHFISEEPPEEVKRRKFDGSFLRIIPFDNGWICDQLLHTEMRVLSERYIRFAPPEKKIQARSPVNCSRCKYVVQCPRENPSHWLNLDKRCTLDQSRVSGTALVSKLKF